MWKSDQCILLCILVVAVFDQILCNDVDSEILDNIRQKRQGRNHPRPLEVDRDRNFDEEEYRAKAQGPARKRQLTEPIALNFVSVLDKVRLNLEGSQGSLLGLGGQPDARPVHHGRSQPEGPVEFNAGRMPPLLNRIFSGHEGRPGQRNTWPKDPQGFQNPRPRRDVNGFVDSRSGKSPGQQNTWPRNLQSFQNTWPGNLPSCQITWPGNLQGFQNPRHEVNNDNLAAAVLLVPLTSPNMWPENFPNTLNTWLGNLQAFQNRTRGDESNGQQNSLPNNEKQGQLNSRNSDQQYNNPSGFSKDNNPYNGVSMKDGPPPNEGEENKNDRQVEPFDIQN